MKKNWMLKKKADCKFMKTVYKNQNFLKADIKNMGGEKIMLILQKKQ